MLSGVFLASSAAVGKRMTMSPRIHEDNEFVDEFVYVFFGDTLVRVRLVFSGLRLILTLIIFLSSALAELDILFPSHALFCSIYSP